MERAKTLVQSMSKDLFKLKKMKSPPQIVKNVALAVLTLLGLPENYTKFTSKMRNVKAFQKELQNLNVKKIKKKTFKRL